MILESLEGELHYDYPDINSPKNCFSDHFSGQPNLNFYEEFLGLTRDRLYDMIELGVQPEGYENDSDKQSIIDFLTDELDTNGYEIVYA